MGKHKKYTQEFKEEAAKLVTEQGYKQSVACKNLGITAKNLSRWVQAAKGLATKKTVQTPESAELVRLKKENHQLRLEREILKKAAAFFANEQS
jgi:Transposase.